MGAFEIEDFSHNCSFHRPDRVKDTLYVITPVFNPQRFRSRWKLYKEFEKYVLSNNQAYLITIECTFGCREKVMVTYPSDKHMIIHVQTEHELWLKENLINIAVSRLPEDWKYLAWIDADIKFARPDWVGETIQKLQHHDFIQMWTQAVDLSPEYEILRHHKGFIYCHKNDIPRLNGSYDGGGNGAYWHPGYAWATKKIAFNHVGGLIDWAILGGADMFMAYALIGELHGKQMPQSLGRSGIKMLKEWQNRCEKHIKRNVGYMDGLLLHYWHGKKKDRKYQDRGQILTKSNFNPDVDLKKDWQGLWQLTDRSPQLRDDIRNYFKNRAEDSIDV